MWIEIGVSALCVHNRLFAWSFLTQWMISMSVEHFELCEQRNNEGQKFHPIGQVSATKGHVSGVGHCDTISLSWQVERNPEAGSSACDHEGIGSLRTESGEPMLEPKVQCRAP